MQVPSELFAHMEVGDHAFLFRTQQGEAGQTVFLADPCKVKEQRDKQ